LSDKQVEVIKMLAGGLTNSEIASRLASTEKVVEHTIARIFFLLDLDKSPELNSRVQLTKAFNLLTGRH
jgi:DNA-binding NarL/FixJ family response regulator